MKALTQSLKAFVSGDNFNQVIKNELGSVKPSELPLYLATTQGGIVAQDPISVSVLNSHDKDTHIESILAIFFDEIVGGCSCGDPPLQISNYCEMQLCIDKQTANATFKVVG